MNEPRTVLVAMSGGVDSSVAAALLVEQGYRVVGLTMKTFCYAGTPGPTRACCGLEGIQDARRVAQRLGIPHYVVDVEEDFTRDVIDDFVQEYAAGRTPNPCVRCNGFTKFRDLLRRGRAFGAEAIATGHYARIARDPDGRVYLRRAVDAAKDQTYFLWMLPRALLPALLFPLGDLTKAEVRQMAASRGLPTAQKPESQEICFVPDGDYRGFLRQRLGDDHPALAPGPLVTRTGAVVGQHTGFAGYTVGQRRGLGAHGRRLYVLEVRPQSREVVVGEAEELLCRGLVVGELNWHLPPPAEGSWVEVQTRHRAPAVPAQVERISDDELHLRFAQPQRTVAPGQSAAIYREEALLGGGRIRRSV